MNIDDIKLEDIKVGSENKDNKPQETPADEPNKGAQGGTDNPAGDDQSNQNGKGAEDVYDEVAAFKALSEDSGIELSSDEEIVMSLRELAGYRKGEIPGMSPALKKAFEIEKQGGNVIAYFQALSRQEDKMDDKEVLQHVFMQRTENAKKPEKLARMDFDREFDNGYGRYFEYQAIKDETEKAAFYEKYGREIEYQKEKYAYDLAEGKKSIKDFRENYPVNAQNQMTQAQIDEVLKRHYQDVDNSLKGFKSVSLPIEGDEVFSLGLNETTRPMVEGWLRNPENFLKAIGIDENKVDVDTLRDVMVVVANISQPSFGSAFKKQILSNKDIDTIENGLGGNREIKRGESNVGAGDKWDQIASAVEAKRNR